MSRIAQEYIELMPPGCDPRLAPNRNTNACFSISRTYESICLNVVQGCGTTHTITYLYVLRPEKEPALNSLKKQAARFQMHSFDIMISMKMPYRLIKYIHKWWICFGKHCYKQISNLQRHCTMLCYKPDMWKHLPERGSRLWQYTYQNLPICLAPWKGACTKQPRKTSCSHPISF